MKKAIRKKERKRNWGPRPTIIAGLNPQKPQFSLNPQSVLNPKNHPEDGNIEENHTIDWTEKEERLESELGLDSDARRCDLCRRD
jgi:hypothetical protein